MIMVTPNLHFDGCCEEAINAYVKAFGARVDCLLRYEDALSQDFSMTLTQEMRRLVYHSEIHIGSQRIMLSDTVDTPETHGLSQFLTLTFDTKEEVTAAYDVLSEGCTVIYPMHSSSYSSCEVNFVDRFGIRWGFMTEQTDR